MSGLAAVLAGRQAPGVHRWESGLAAADVRHAVEHAGWSFGYVDGAALDDLRPVLRAIAEALAFPDYFGGTLDGLHDCLRDLPGPTVLLWDAWSGFARADPVRFATVVEILGERDADDPPIQVLLRGPGPEDAAPLLD